MRIHSANSCLGTSPLGCGLRYYKHRRKAKSVLSLSLSLSQLVVCSQLPASTQQRTIERLSYFECSLINICYPLLWALVDLEHLQLSSALWSSGKLYLLDHKQNITTVWRWEVSTWHTKNRQLRNAIKSARNIPPQECPVPNSQPGKHIFRETEKVAFL